MKDLKMIRKLLTFIIIGISVALSTTYASEAPPSKYEELNCIYKVTHPAYPDCKIYLLGAKHCNSEILENNVDFIVNNCDTVYFECDDNPSVFEYNTEIYERYAERKETSTSCFLPKNSELLNAVERYSGFANAMYICKNYHNISQIVQEMYISRNLQNLWNELILFDQILIKLHFGELQAPENLEIDKYIHPVDLITETLYNIGLKSALEINKNSNEIFEIGTEEDLEEKLKRKSSGISFAYLETGSDIMRALRNIVLEHTTENDPYIKWIELFEEAKSISGKNSLEEALIADEDEIISKNLPPLLRKIYLDALFPAREKPWLVKIKNSFMNSKGQKADLFNVGVKHIANIIQKFSEEGYETNKLDL